MGSLQEADRMGMDAQHPGKIADSDVTEVTLLLSSERLQALVAHSHRQGKSVAQILRRLIDRELATNS